VDEGFTPAAVIDVSIAAIELLPSARVRHGASITTLAATGFICSFP